MIVEMDLKRQHGVPVTGQVEVLLRLPDGRDTIIDIITQSPGTGFWCRVFDIVYACDSTASPDQMPWLIQVLYYRQRPDEIPEDRYQEFKVFRCRCCRRVLQRLRS